MRAVSIPLLVAALLPAAAQAQSACDAVNSGSLDFTASFDSASAPTGTAAARGATAAAQGLKSSAFTGSASSFVSPNVTFTAGDRITYSVDYTVTVPGFSVQFQSASGSATAASDEFAVADVGGTAPPSPLTYTQTIGAGTTAIRTFIYRSNTNMRGSFTVAATCTPAAVAPSVTSLSPTSGSTAGGTSVTLSGADFVASNTSVTIGATTIPAGSVNVASATSLSFTTPANAAGNVAVSVTTPGGTSGAVPGGFTYVAPPAAPVVASPADGAVLQSTTPTYSGTTAAGATVTVTVDGTSIGTTTADGSGNWSLTQPTTLSSGSHTVRAAATVSGVTGAESATSNFVVASPPTISGSFSPASIVSGGASTTLTLTLTNPNGFTLSNLAVTDTLPSALNGSGVSTSCGGGTATYDAGSGVLSLSGGSLAGGANCAVTLTVSSATPGFYALITDPVSASYNGTTLTGGTATTNSLTVQAAAPTLAASLAPTSITTGGEARLTLTFANPNLAGSLNNVSLTVDLPSGVTSPGMPNPSSTCAGGVSISRPSASRMQIANVSISPQASCTFSFNVTSSTPGSYSIATGAPVAPGASTGAQGTPATLTVTAAPPALSPATVSAVAYGSTGNMRDAETATGATNSPTAWSVAQDAAGPFAATATSANAAATNVSIAASGLLTYAAPAGFRGNDVFYVRASNSGGDSNVVAITVTVGNPTLAITLSNPSGARDTPLTGTAINASGGAAPYSCATAPASGALPSGVVINGDCTVTGTPTASGTFNFTASVTDSSTGTGPFTATSGTLTLTVAEPTVAIAPATLPSATAGTAYSQTLTASGATAPYNFAIVTGAIPAGMTLATDGTLSGTPTAGGTFNFTVRATDSSSAGSGGPYSANRAYTLTVASATISLAPSSLPGGTSNIAYSQTLTATGGVGSYTFAVTAGGLPSGLSLATNGTLSGTPTAAGTFNFTVTATDSATGTGPYSGSRAYALTITAPTIALDPTTLPAATTNVAYSQPITASGGTGPYSFTVTAGALPTGLVLATNGTLSGTATAAGSYSFTVTATDANTNSGSQGYSITVAAPTIALDPTTLPAASTNVAYSRSITASGGTGPYSFTVTAGALPTGLVLAANGTLSGTPTAAGTYSFTVTATDANTNSGAQGYSITVAAPTIALSPAALPGGAVGASYNQALTASGGVAPYTFAVSAGVTPTGLSLAANGTLSGTPSAGGSFTFTVTATDANTNVGSRPYTVVIASPTLTLAPSALPAGTVNAAYSQALSASGGTAPYSYAVTAGALPAGLTLGTNGTLSGTPSATGTYNFTVTATDSSSGTGPYQTSAPLSLVISAPTLAISGSGPSGTQVGAAYSQSNSASGGQGAYLYALASGALPSGTSLDSSTGMVSGTPQVAGAFSYAVRVTDANGAGTSATGPTVTGTIAQATTSTSVAISTASAAAGAAVRYTASVSGGVAPGTGATVSFTSNGAAIPGCEAIAATGGTAACDTSAPAAGSYAIVASYSGNANNAASSSAPATLTVARASTSVAVSSPGPIVAGTSVTYTASVTGASPTGSIAFAANGNPIAGCETAALSGGSATCTQTPSAAGDYTITAAYSGDANNEASSSSPITQNVIASLTVTQAVAEVRGVVGASLDPIAPVIATGGTGSPTYALGGGTLPAGLSFSTATGQLSGTPTAALAATQFTVTATDQGTPTPQSGSRTFTLTVVQAAQTISFTSTPPSPAQVGGSYVPAATASSGLATVFTLDPASGATCTIEAGTVRFAAAGTCIVNANQPGDTTYAAAPQVQQSITVTEAAPVAADATLAVPYAGSGTTLDLSGSISGSYSAIAIAGEPTKGRVTVSGSTVTYTPDAEAFGDDSFSYTATGAGGTSQPATVRVTIAAPPPPVVDPSNTNVGSSTVTDSNSVTIDLGALVVGTYDRIEIITPPANGTLTLLNGGVPTTAGRPRARAGGQGTLAVPAAGPSVYAVYTPNPGFTGSDSFEFAAVGPGGISTPASFTIAVLSQAPVAQTLSATTGDGQMVAVDLVATGGSGPLSGADIVSVTPADAATARIVPNGSGSYRLEVTPAARFGGIVTVRYTLSNAFGVSAPAVVTVTVEARPDPRSDPTVAAVSDAQAETVRRFGQAQVQNFMQRAEQLHGGGGSSAPHMGVRLAARDGRSFAATPQGYDDSALAITERMRRSGEDPALGRYSAANPQRSLQPGALGLPSGMALDATGAAPAEGAQDGETGSGPRRAGSLGSWIGGSIDIGTLDRRTGRDKITASTAGLSGGIDLMLAEGAFVGIGAGYGNELSEIGGGDARIRSETNLLAVYASLSPFEAAYLDAMLARGQLSFRTRRLAEAAAATAYGQRDGDYLLGALSASVDRRSGRFGWSLYGRGEYMNAELDAYTETGAGRYALRFEERDVTSVTGTLGARLDYRREFAEGGSVTPRLRIEWNHEFADVDAQFLDYADIVGPALYQLDGRGWQRERFGLSFGLLVELLSGWNFDVETSLRAAQGEQSGTLRMRIGTRF